MDSLADRINRYMAFKDNQEMGSPDISPEEWDALPEEVKKAILGAQQEQPKPDSRFQAIRNMLGSK